MSPGLRGGMKKRVEHLRTLPSSPAVLQPLLELLRQPIETIEVRKVVELVSYDKTIAAQCLRMANSPLYGRTNEAGSVQTAILVLGIQRVEDILLTCCLQRFSEGADGGSELAAFWMHSLGCAAVCREFAVRAGYREPENAYLAGLLHDLGILVNSLAYESEYGKVLHEARERGAALAEIEFKELGFTHCESGAVLGVSWQLPHAIQEVIQYHHDVERAPAGNPLVALVHLADLLCRMRGLGYGYDEWHGVDIMADPACAELASCCPRLGKMDLARFTMDLDAFLPKVQTLVETVFASRAKQCLSEVHP